MKAGKNGRNTLTYRRLRRRVACAAALGTSILVLGGTAYACTAFRGKLTITNNSNMTSSWADGDTSGMTHCSLSTGATAGRNSGNSITLTVSAATTCTGGAAGNTLTNQSNYNLKFYDGGHQGSFSPGTNPTYDSAADACMSGTATQTFATGQTYSGSGSTSYGPYTLATGLTANGNNDYSAACIIDGNQGLGNAVPILIT